MMLATDFPNIRHLPRDQKFDQLRERGYIDLNSGAWDFAANVRAAKCGRCGTPLMKGQGAAYNEFMSDGYRATTKYLCCGCDPRQPEPRG